MIEVAFLKKKHAMVGYEITGHAMFAAYGSDPVCAGVSALAIGSLNTMTDVLQLSDAIEYHIEEGNMLCRINFTKLSAQERRDVDIVLKGLEVNLDASAQAYPESVCITYKEV